MSTALKGLRLNFGEENVSLDLAAPVTGFDATIQCVLTNLGTSLGTDRVYPDDRGAELRTAGLMGQLFNQQQAAHIANFGAVRTREFVEAHTPADVTERIRRLRVVPKTLTLGHLETDIIIETSTGLVVGRSSSV